MIKNYISVFVLLVSCTVFSQSIERQVIGSSGATYSNGSVTMDFTVGEVAITSIDNGSVFFSQGFHQGVIVLSIIVNPIAYIQGAGINPNSGEETLMRDDLRIANLIPLVSPYPDGLIAGASVFTNVGTDAIIDWVWVELRDENDDSVIIDSQSALIQRDGDVVAVDGVTALSFEQPVGNYFVSVNHRNHLGIISASAIALNNTSSVIDFTLSSVSAQGGTNALTLLSNGKYASYSGDYNNDELIQNNDAQAVVPLIGSSGYSNADMDVNTLIQNTDLNNLVITNIGRAQQYSRHTVSVLSSDIHFTFANAQITTAGSTDYYEADILIESTEDFKLGSGQFYLNYNELAFGTNISANGKIEYSQPAGSILGEEYGFPAYKDFIQNDTYDTTVSLSFQQGVSSGTIPVNNVIATAKILCHIKIEYLNSNEDPEICFETQPAFLDQFYTACGPETNGFPDCFNNPGEQLFNDSFDCSGAALGTLSVNEFENETIKLFPNPANEMFYINGLLDEAIVTIYDISGKIMLSQSVISNQAISVDKLSSGMYMVSIQSQNNSIVKKLVIE